MTDPELLSVRPIAVDLFAGAGGFSLGAEQAGWDVAASVEIDPIHARTHRTNLPQCSVLVADAAEVSGQRISDLILSSRPSWDGVVDLVIGGPPCQGFSSGGHQKVDDARNDLVLEFARLVVELRPRAFAMENVRGLLNGQYDSLRAEFSTMLRGAGYFLVGLDDWVQCRDFGLPQDRKRVVVRGALNRADVGPLLASAPVRHTVQEALYGLPEVRVRRSGASTVRLEREQREALDAFRATPYGRLVDPSPESRPGGIAVLHNCRVTEHTPETRKRFARTEPGGIDAVSRYFRLEAHGVSRTLRAGTGSDRGSYTAPRPIHPSRNRVLTVRESARLQGFPDWFIFDETVWHGQRQVGNSVPPPVARAVVASLASPATGVSVPLELEIATG